mmetsp:Transcript_44936/g.101720  ORF Transcript_44936/g.101720 Transcript_44936/m.101720 type:complete len:324 (+) Transcript_44936:1451-2422(+)
MSRLRAGRQKRHWLLRPLQACEFLALAGGGPLRAQLEAIALLLVELERHIGRQEVDVRHPSTHPIVRHNDIALHDLTTPRIDLRDAHADSLIVGCPRNCAVTRVADVVIRRPIRVRRQDGADALRSLDQYEGIVPSLDSLAKVLAPTDGHRRVHIETDLASGQSRKVIAPDHRDLPVSSIFILLLRPPAVLAQIAVVRCKIEHPIIAEPWRHRRRGQEDHGVANRLGIPQASHIVLHRNVEIPGIRLRTQHAIREALADRGRDKEAKPDEVGGVDNNAALVQLQVVRIHHVISRPSAASRPRPAERPHCLRACGSRFAAFQGG